MTSLFVPDLVSASPWEDAVWEWWRGDRKLTVYVPDVGPLEIVATRGDEQEVSSVCVEARWGADMRWLRTWLEGS